MTSGDGSQRGLWGARGDDAHKTPPTIDQQKLEAIRRQLDAEFPSERRASRGREDPRDERGSPGRRLALLVTGFLAAGALMAVGALLYLAPSDRADAPGLNAAAERPVARPEPTAPPPAPPVLTTAPSPDRAALDPAPGQKEAATAKSSPPPTLPPRTADRAVRTLPPRPPAPETPRMAADPGAAREAQVAPPPSSLPPGAPARPARPELDVRAGGSRPAAEDRRPATATPGMNRYTDPQGLFGIEYPLGWRVRPASAVGKPTSFYLDDPDEGIAVIVLTQGAVQGDMRTAALAPLLIQQMRQTYPDFRLTTVSTRPLSGGGEQSEFVALWTNRWTQRMRTKGMIVSAARGGATTYSYVAGQAQELVFPGVEPVIQRMLESFQPASRG